MSVATGREPARLERAATPPRERVLSPLARASLRFLLIAAAAAVFAYVLVHIRLVVVPFVVALLVTSLLRPAVDRLCVRGMPRPAAAAAVLVLWLSLLVAVLAAIAPAVVDELGALGDSVAKGIDQVTQFVATGPFGLSEREVDRAVTRAGEQLRGGAGTVAQGVLDVGMVAVEVLAGALLALVLTFYLLLDGDRVWGWVSELTPPGQQDELRAFGTEAWRSLSGYVRGVVLVAIVDAVFIGLALVIIGVPLVLPLMVLTFLAGFVPLVGAVVAGAAAALVALVAIGPVAALLVVAAVVVVQQLEGNLLYPIVVGRSLSLHPIAILLAVTAGGVLLGVVGAALAVPLLAVVWAGVKAWRVEPAA